MVRTTLREVNWTPTRDRPAAGRDRTGPIARSFLLFRDKKQVRAATKLASPRLWTVADDATPAADRLQCDRRTAAGSRSCQIHPNVRHVMCTHRAGWLRPAAGHGADRSEAPAGSHLAHAACTARHRLLSDAAPTVSIGVEAGDAMLATLRFSYGPLERRGGRRVCGLVSLGCNRPVPVCFCLLGRVHTLASSSSEGLSMYLHEN